jgi:hypothetical protein
MQIREVGWMGVVFGLGVKGYAAPIVAAVKCFDHASKTKN